ncbi:hypothetical protein KVR01_010596 [Diaporthe batatas]|uniref:uncharacterized protein n=1 Tax=Diaporthe batatas TaxID=748121 RepID=UPI001D04A13D|nr:uncharacterized protein KVR01_010596 [Diaporthe batatas]KAG8159959.1 hypothetical protein KVR01_010596 [Diaporthe batatas]
MDGPSRNLPFTRGTPFESGLRHSSAQNMATASVEPNQTGPQCHSISHTNPTFFPVGRSLPPIPNLHNSKTYPAHSINDGGISPREVSDNSSGFPVAPYGDHYTPCQGLQWLHQPRQSFDSMRVAPNLTRSYPEAGQYHIPIDPQEPEFKRCRLGSANWSTSLEVSSWEIDALAVAKSRRASNQQVSLADMPTSSWTTPAHSTTSSSPPEISLGNSHKSGTWQQHSLAYPSPPQCLDDNTRRLSYRGPSPRRTSSVFSDGALTGSPEASWSTVGFDGHKSPPTSPTITSTTLGFDSRPCSMGPGESTPTFEEIYDVPQVDLAPRQTERKSILERFPMKIFMRIMVHCDWKQQILLRRCNSNMYNMVRLDAIPWEIKTAILLYEENFNPENFKPSKSQDDHGSEEHDSDAAPSSDNEGSLSSKAKKGKKGRRKDVSKSKPQGKKKQGEEDFKKFACYSCYKILPSYYFEGRNLETKTGRTGTSQKKRGHNNQSGKKVDTRVEYVQVISVDPGSPPEWLVEDKAEVKATDVETYVTEYMKRGVNCDDLRLYYKDITSGTHCIAPVRGVNPFFTASSSATPQQCETYRPVYPVEPSNSPGVGADSSAYTYELCIPENSARDENPMGRPRFGQITRICQPQQLQEGPPDAHGLCLSAPAPQVNDIIALRRFCILCGAKYGAYRRDCNRRIINMEEDGFWVCDCRKVRPTGVGRSCPDCGRSVIY